MATCVFHDTGMGARDRRVFEVIEREVADGNKVVVFAGDKARAGQIDRFLWILRQESFLPHRIFEAADPGALEPIAIVTGEVNPIGGSVLVADGHCSLEFAQGFESVHEFVDRSSAEAHQLCRDRFRAYQARKITVTYLK